jgi:predicted nuclease of restriction endonuclease-like (RecB) superfamily
VVSSTIVNRSRSEADLYRRVRAILIAAQRVVARTVNSEQVAANWLTGREIIEQEQSGAPRARYGHELLARLAMRLTREFGVGYSVDNLELFRRFYLEYPSLITIEISDAVRRKSRIHLQAPLRVDQWQPGSLHPNLSWTHYRALLRAPSEGARTFYEIEAIRNNWSARGLERQMASLLYERLAKSRDKKGLMRLATKGQEIARAIDIFKDPVVVEFLGMRESPKLVESELEAAMLSNLQSFLLELGTGFAFLARQQRITLDGDHFYIDLVFYHAILKCYVVVDLKVGKITHADLGQLQLYVNYYDLERRTEGDGPTLGLIICSDKNDAVVRYTLGPHQENKIFASRYKLHLPSESELRDELRREVRSLRQKQVDSASRAIVHMPAAGEPRSSAR